ncbi:MAG: bifunctional glutamate N-acetyltransferase/amino-acid acetyltransferase ArgJ [Lentisphaeria bacterium]|nr:bifunctional glutamate N-acetyltransferase/amino-acid acetyltransferase ArgJ [Lentisphaeria bacterium]
MKVKYELIEGGGVCSPKGFQASGATAGIKHSGNSDMSLIYSQTPAKFAGAYTQNRFAAPPVLYSRELSSRVDHIHACITNSGNANAVTGHQGYLDAVQMANKTAEALDIEQDEVLVFSTGRIGVPLPMDKINSAIPLLVQNLSDVANKHTAEGIMTTDTEPKYMAIKVNIAGQDICIGGMAKGVGMLAPNMKTAKKKEATMLTYVTTDAAFADGVLEDVLEQSLDVSFNAITVDGDTSTNDSFVILANGEAANEPISKGSLAADQFQEAFDYLCGELAKWLITDGEGANRLVEFLVSGADTKANAQTCAKAIANSLLCKTAWFGGDPNWGRILDVAGYCGVDFDPAKVSLYFRDTAVVKGGLPVGYSDEELEPLVEGDLLSFELNLGMGQEEYRVWTCDLSYEYVKINAEYRT